jgi:hypothetical protein
MKKGPGGPGVSWMATLWRISHQVGVSTNQVQAQIF